MRLSGDLAAKAGSNTYSLTNFPLSQAPAVVKAALEDWHQVNEDLVRGPMARRNGLQHAPR